MYYSGPEKDSFRVFPWLSDGISRRPYLRLDADCQHFEDVRQVSDSRLTLSSAEQDDAVNGMV